MHFHYNKTTRSDLNFKEISGNFQENLNIHFRTFFVKIRDFYLFFVAARRLMADFTTLQSSHILAFL